MQPRRELRVHCFLVAQIMEISRNMKNKKGKALCVRVTNISATGVYFNTTERLYASKDYIMELHINKVIENIKVRIIRMHEESRVFYYGAEFNEMQPSTQKNIKAYVYKMQPRKDVRINCRIIAKITLEEGTSNLWQKESYVVEINNISAAGVSFIADENIYEGRQYILEIPINDNVEKVKCRVVRKHIVAGSYYYGIKFEEMSVETETILRAYVYSLQLSKMKNNI